MITKDNIDFLTRYGSKEHLDKLMGDPKTSSYQAMSNPYFDHTHIQKLLDMNHESLHEITYHPALFEKATPDQITALSKSKDKDVLSDLTSRTDKLEPHHIENILNSVTSDVKLDSGAYKNLGSMKNATPEQFDRIVGLHNIHVNEGLAANNNLPEKHIRKFVGSPYPNIRMKIAKHPKLSEYNMKRLANDENEYVRSRIAARKDLPDHLIDKLKDDPYQTVRSAVWETHKR